MKIAWLLLIWIALSGSPAVEATTLSIEPASSVFSVGDPFSLDIRVADVTDLFAFQFDIGFSPSILFATSITEGAFLPSGGATFFISGTIDNGSGAISSTADALIGPILGVTGSGSLATVTFQALAAGSSKVDLSNVILLDSNFIEIDFTSPGGATVEVQRTSPVPEPRTFLLLLSGCASFWLWRLVKYGVKDRLGFKNRVGLPFADGILVSSTSMRYHGGLWQIRPQ
ncbi:MAG: cohesin domain-containing protein [Pseudomonadota bacterium]